MKRIGVVDTTFARVDMGGAAVRALKAAGSGFRIARRTVPGIKDLPVACRALFREARADLCLALGMPGAAELDRLSAMEASMGLMMAQVLEGKPILEVFVFEGEARDARELDWLARRRSEEHARNAFDLLFRPRALERLAGTGQRQGYADVGSVRPTS